MREQGIFLSCFCLLIIESARIEPVFCDVQQPVAQNHSLLASIELSPADRAIILKATVPNW